MNREIKFRAYDTKLGKWIEPQDLSISANGWPLVWDAERDCFRSRVQTVVLQQFTGLYDKNGKEIYEGDIMTHPEFTAPSMGEISIQKGCVWFGGGWDCLRTDLSKGEVVGNIHENPDLLLR